MNSRTVILMICFLFLVTLAYAADVPETYLKTSIGLGQLYGGRYGINNEIIVNEYVSGQVGVGYSDHVGVSAIAGLSGYPLRNNQYTVSPRFTALYGRVGSIHYSDDSYKNGYGYSLGGGIEYPFASTSRGRVNFDLFYSAMTTPEKDDGKITLSFGVGYSFK